MEKELLTQSGLKLYLTCSKKWDYRQEQSLVPLEEAPALRFGSSYHDILELRNTGHDLKECIFSLEETYADREMDESGKMISEFCCLVGMTVAYFNRYPLEDEEFTFEKVESKIKAPLINPDTQRASRSFDFSGKCDGVVKDKETGKLSLYELKTSSQIDRAYILKVASFDVQCAIYTHHLNLDSVIYDVVKKPTIKRKKSVKVYDEIQEFKKDGEPKKNKTKILKEERPESEEEYIKRIASWYEIDTDDKLCRLSLVVTEQDKLRAMRTLWSVSQKILHDRRDSFFIQNAGSCEKWGRFCEYYDICTSHESEIIKQNQFKTREINSELTDKKPVF